MIHTNKSGFILPLTLAIIGLFMFLATYITNKSLIFGSYTKTMVAREKSRQLAFGGIQLAIAQLARTPEKQEEKAPAQNKETAKDKQEQPSEAKFLLKNILPILNRAQRIILKQSIEGLNGTIIMVIGCEEGKININKLYDFEKHIFVGQGQAQGDMRVVFQELFTLIKEQMGVDLFEEFEKFMKERKYPLNDVTQLLTIKGFEVFKNLVFFDPLAPAVSGKKAIYLTDIFTVSSSRRTLEPWLLSDSMASLLKLKIDIEKKPDYGQLLKNFKEKSDWKNDWAKSLQQRYGIDFNALPKSIVQLFNPSFEPKTFSVLVQAIVAKVSVKLFAIVEREKGTSKDAPMQVYIRKIYLV